MENPTEPATTFPFTFYSLLPTAQDVSQVNSLLPTQKEWTKFSCLAGQAIDKNWQALLIRQLVSYLGPSMQEYLRLHGMAVNFMGNKARTLVKVNLGLNWSIQRGEKLTFYRLRFNPATLQLEYTELTQGIVTVLLNNSFAWVSVPKPAANKILWGDLSLKQTGSLTHFLNF